MSAFPPKAIHALPVELLTRVFVLGADSDDPYRLSPFLLKPDQNYYAVPSTLFQLTAAHVCHRWRHVALHTPSLWTTLCFREQSHIPRAAAYLERSARSTSRRLDILVDTVAPQDHVPGVTLCRDELTAIFDLISPHVPFWRAFHLKIRDDTCKQIARKYLGNAPPAPNLQTLQLYHFEDFRVAQDLYIATYRRPVRIFSNSLPSLRNVSLIGVNLPWDQSPYLHSLHTLELALHSDHTRPSYTYWDRMLQLSPHLQRLLLHYSGPRAENGTEDLAWMPRHDDYDFDYDYHDHSLYPPHSQHNDISRKRKGKAKQDDCVLLEFLWELSLTDLDPDYLCRVLQRLVMPNVNKLSLDLPDQDFTPFVELIAPPPPPLDSPFPCDAPPVDPAQFPEQDPNGHSTGSGGGLGSGSLRHLVSSASLSTEQGQPSPGASNSSSSAQTPMFQTMQSAPPPSAIPVASSSSNSSASSPLSSAIKPTFSSISPSTMTSTMPPSPIFTNATNTNSISVNSLTNFGSTSHSIPSAHDLSPSQSPSLRLSHSPFKRSPLPRISTTLHTLIITALECEYHAWQAFFVAMEGVQVLEVNFYKVCVTGASVSGGDGDGVGEDRVVVEEEGGENRRGGGGGGGSEGCVAYKVLLDRVSVDVDDSQGVRGTRMVLPMLRKCKVAGLSGRIVRRLVQGRELAGGQRVEQWLVVEDKYGQGDGVLNEVFERGVWVADGAKEVAGHGRVGGREGRWVKVQKVVEEDEEEDGEEDEEVEEADVEVEDVSEVVEGIENEAVGDAGLDDYDAEEDSLDDEVEVEVSTAAAAEEVQLLAEQYIYYLDTQSTAGVTVKSRATSVGGSSTSDSGSGISDYTSASSSSSASTSSAGACRSMRRIDSHRGME